MLVSTHSWQVYFEDVLPDAENAQGLIAVLENNCGQQFTYTINGASASYLGPGDLHDPIYDDHVVSTGFGAFLGKNVNKSGESECDYNVRVYPSRALEESFMTSTPLVFTVVVVCTFFVTSLIFLLYDFVVERRQTVVLKKAVQSTEVVNTLFPETVRDRLFEERDKKPMSDTFAADKSPMSEESTSTMVADLYQDCTVLFADLAGRCPVFPSPITIVIY